MERAGLMPNKKRIGITGGIATGKSTATAYIRSKGYPVIDADALAHDLSDADPDYIGAVARAFGKDVLTEDGRIDRVKLGNIVFSDALKRLELNAIAHPRIFRAMETEVEKAFAVSDVVFLDIPLLYEISNATDFDAVWLVYTPSHVQTERLMRRDGIDLSEAQKRIQAQMPMEEKRKLADVVIYNEGTLSDLEGQIDRQLEYLT